MWLEAVKLLLFTGAMILAAVWDVRTRTVPGWLLLALSVIGCISFDMGSLAGLLLCGVPLLVYAAWTDAMGGGDVKLAAMCGFCLKGLCGLAGVALGLLLSILLVPLIHKLQNKPLNSAFPLVPYLAAGTVASSLFFTLWR